MAGAETYRGRIAPTPTGLLHLGHARTFWTAWRRARERGGKLILRIDDLDEARSSVEHALAAVEDLRWLGLDWDEGPDVSGPHEPYVQSDRRELYLRAWRRLLDIGIIYPCLRSRKDVQRAVSAPHAEDEDAEPLYPKEWRPEPGKGQDFGAPAGANWRFRVPDGVVVRFEDARFGPQSFEAGKDFGDFVVWRRDDVPAYELAVVVDDHEMGITEVVRGADLLRSTARQLLVYRALGWTAPVFHHCPLVLDESGKRLAKRSNALSLRALREAGKSPAELAQAFEAGLAAAPSAVGAT